MGTTYLNNMVFFLSNHQSYKVVMYSYILCEELLKAHCNVDVIEFLSKKVNIIVIYNNKLYKYRTPQACLWRTAASNIGFYFKIKLSVFVIISVSVTLSFPTIINMGLYLQ